jgi:aspartate aminotransferase-like enzyme
MINHRGPEFAALLGRVTEQLQFFFQTKNRILTYPSSGSGGWEATVVNLFSPGDTILSAPTGVFGERFASVAKTFGLNVERVETEWGQAANPEAVAEALKNLPQAKGVFLTQNETSTGVMNDIEALAKAIRAVRSDVLICVDAVSSLSCVDLQTDNWDLDIVLTGSQKGWMVPPGLAMVSVSDRAWEAHKNATLPRFYWDFTKVAKNADKGQTPYTPPVTIFFGLDVSLAMMREEGRQAIFARHQACADLTRSRAKSLGLELYPNPAVASNTVTAIWAPESVGGAKAITKAMREQEAVVLAGGQEKLEGKIFRIGHLGWVHEADITACMDALERQLKALGFQTPAAVGN